MMTEVVQRLPETKKKIQKNLNNVVVRSSSSSIHIRLLIKEEYMMNAGGRFSNLEGKFTSTVYGLIRDQKYADAIKILTYQLQLFPRNRAALSLIGYCQYYMQDFLASAQTYELLVKHHPNIVEYKIYYAQSLLKSGMHAEANKIATQIDHPQYTQRIQHLKACIAFEQGELETCKALIERNETFRDDPNTIVSRACIEFKEGKFESARKMFMEAINIIGYQANLAYNVALCYYMEKQFGSALKHIAEIIEKGVREHPELSVGSNTEQLNVRSVGNSQVLQETALIEAFNLKAAIEYNLNNIDAARMALNDMPPRSESELDAVTLHNQALINVDRDTTNSFRKLNFLLQNPPFPKPTFSNLLILYCKFE
jgi:tetratricopeptide repeat protein 30